MNKELRLPPSPLSRARGVLNEVKGRRKIELIRHAAIESRRRAPAALVLRAPERYRAAVAGPGWMNLESSTSAFT